MNIQSIDDLGLGVWDSENHWGVIGHDFTWIFHTQKINGRTMEPYFSMACYGSPRDPSASFLSSNHGLAHVF